MTTFLLLAALVCLLLLRVPVAFALGGLGLVMLIGGGFPLMIVPQAVLASADGRQLLAVPLLVLMSNILLKGGVARDIFSTVYALTRRLPGGSVVATVFSGALLSALSGASVTSLTAVGVLTLPQVVRQMVQNGGEPRTAYGLVVVSGILGSLLAPSIPLLLFASLTGQNAHSLFTAAAGPAALLFVLTLCHALLHQWSHKGEPTGGGTVSSSKVSHVAQSEVPEFSGRQTVQRGGPAILIILLMMGAIYAGLASVTEAAAIGCVVSLLLVGGIYKSLTGRAFREIAFESMITTTALLVLLAGVSLFAKAVLLYQIPQDIAATFHASQSGSLWLVLVIGGAVLAMGLILEAVSSILILTPMLLSAAVVLGFDPVWFGVFVVLVVECALIVPPVGLNIYVIQSVARDHLGEVVRGVIPYVMLTLVCILVLYLCPSLALYIPYKL